MRFSRQGLPLQLSFDDYPESMMRSDNPTALTDEVARFQAEVRRLALAAVQAIIKEELERKRAALPAARPSPRASKAREQIALPLPAVPAAPSAAPASAGKKRVQWTHESIIHELATWMSSGTAIDAAFVSRHGPPGLVPAARRIFGRFEAALNVAGLHVSKLNPDGPPPRA